MGLSTRRPASSVSATAPPTTRSSCFTPVSGFPLVSPRSRSFASDSAGARLAITALLGAWTAGGATGAGASPARGSAGAGGVAGAAYDWTAGGGAVAGAFAAAASWRARAASASRRASAGSRCSTTRGAVTSSTRTACLSSGAWR